MSATVPCRTLSRLVTGRGMSATRRCRGFARKASTMRKHCGRRSRNRFTANNDGCRIRGTQYRFSHCGLPGRPGRPPPKSEMRRPAAIARLPRRMAIRCRRRWKKHVGRDEIPASLSRRPNGMPGFHPGLRCSSDAAHDDTLRQPMKEVKGISGDFALRLRGVVYVPRAKATPAPEGQLRSSHGPKRPLPRRGNCALATGESPWWPMFR